MAYWFPGESSGRPSALAVRNDGLLTLVLTNRFGVFRATRAEHVGQIDAAREGRRLLLRSPSTLGESFEVDFPDEEHARRVEAVMDWFREHNALRIFGNPIVSVEWQCYYIGGSGLHLTPGESYDLMFRSNSIEIHAAPLSLIFPSLAAVPIADLQSLQLGGPGEYQTGGGFIGFGFGLKNSLKSIAIADLLNKLTTRTRVYTTITVATSAIEAFFVSTLTPPDQMRMELSPIFLDLAERATQLKEIQRGPARSEDIDMVSQIERLDSLRISGALTEDEFTAAKSRLLNP